MSGWFNRNVTEPPPVEKPPAPSFWSTVSFRRIGVEVASIVLAVLLALWLNEWRSSVNQRKATQAALIHVREEHQSCRDCKFKKPLGTLSRMPAMPASLIWN